MQSTILNLVPMAHVADVQRSSDFYALLGFKMASTFKNGAGILCWADLVSGGARIMVTRASGPIVADQQAVLFYLYVDDLIGLREKLLEKGVTTPEITYPFYMEKGEFRLADPDGYVLLIGQAG
jgi:Glyoxalase/Bleomycin resistance protein/Dioxygenase superfamily